jgi:hypothetical protein
VLTTFDRQNQFVVKVDQIELETEIDFLPILNEELENQLEGNINIYSWRF